MLTVKITEFCIWGVVGILVLNDNKVSKVEYGLVWLMLLLHCIKDIVTM